MALHEERPPSPPPLLHSTAPCPPSPAAPHAYPSSSTHPPDLDKVAHYVMLRFGEEAEASDSEEERESGDGGGSRHSSGSRPAAATKQHRQRQHQAQAGRPGLGDFAIAAHRGMEGDGGSPRAQLVPAQPAPAPRVLSSAELFGGAGEASNGRRLAHAMQTEVEQRGAADAGLSVLQAQASLAASQQRLLDGQRQLMAQHTTVLAAVGGAAGSMQQQQQAAGAGTDGSWANPLWSAVPSFRQRAVQRSDSGRTSSLLPPRRPVGAVSARGLRLRLSDTSEEEGR